MCGTSNEFITNYLRNEIANIEYSSDLNIERNNILLIIAYELSRIADAVCDLNRYGLKTYPDA